ncbi:hypothetical protein [Secundilactobacillus silagincola]|nr:hypothetical protein [Secundilactobacillus silagincola]
MIYHHDYPERTEDYYPVGSLKPDRFFQPTKADGPDITIPCN